MSLTLDEVLDVMGELLLRLRGSFPLSSVAIVMASPVRKTWLPAVTNREAATVSVPVQSEVLPMAAFLLVDDQEVDLALDLRDRFGNPTTGYGVPQWAVSDLSLLSITPSADGMTCLVQAVGKTGGAQVTVKVQRSSNPADVITGVQDFTIQASEATFVGLVSGPARIISTTPTTTTTPTVLPTVVGPQGAQGEPGPQGAQV